MKKNSSKGFMLAETLVVTTFVAGVLIFLFIQFSNLNKNYENSYKYNSIEGLYAARNIKYFIESDTDFIASLSEKVNHNNFLDITDCSVFTEKEYCLKLFEIENIEKAFITTNEINKDLFYEYDEGIKKFINRINTEGTQEYRLLISFKDSTYSTIRFGD